jgi:hypothetical protein
LTIRQSKAGESPSLSSSVICSAIWVQDTHRRTAFSFLSVSLSTRFPLAPLFCLSLSFLLMEVHCLPVS